MAGLQCGSQQYNRAISRPYTGAPSKSCGYRRVRQLAAASERAPGGVRRSCWQIKDVDVFSAQQLLWLPSRHEREPAAEVFREAFRYSPGRDSAEPFVVTGYKCAASGTAESV